MQNVDFVAAISNIKQLSQGKPFPYRRRKREEKIKEPNNNSTGNGMGKKEEGKKKSHVIGRQGDPNETCTEITG